MEIVQECLLSCFFVSPVLFQTKGSRINMNQWLTSEQLWLHGPAGSSQEDFQRHTLQSAENDASVAEEGLRKAESVANEFEAQNIWQGSCQGCQNALKDLSECLEIWWMLRVAACPSMTRKGLARQSLMLLKSFKLWQHANILPINVQIPDKVYAASPPHDYLRTIIIIRQNKLCRWHLGRRTPTTPLKVSTPVFLECATITSLVQKGSEHLPSYSPHIPNSLSVFEPMASSCSGGCKVKGSFPETLHRSLVLRWGGVRFPHRNLTKQKPSNLELKLKSGTCLKHSKAQWWLEYCCTTGRTSKYPMTHTIVFK